ncbi:hypothetical protein ABPG74_002666 [Tetrahymena malaccensis]
MHTDDPYNYQVLKQGLEVLENNKALLNMFNIPWKMVEIEEEPQLSTNQSSDAPNPPTILPILPASKSIKIEENHRKDCKNSQQQLLIGKILTQYQLHKQVTR